MRLRYTLLGAIAALTLSQGAQAASIIGKDALNEWNLIVLGNANQTVSGDLSGNAHIHGRSFIAGNVTSQNAVDFNMDSTTSTRGQAGVTVVGNVQGTDKKVWKNATIGGSSSGALVLNGNGQTIKVGGTLPNGNYGGNTIQTGLAASSPTFTSSLTQQRTDLISSMIALSDQLKGLSATTSTAGVTFANNKGTFTSTGSGINVINISAANLASIGEIQFNNAGTTIVNVSGTNVVLNDNFLGPSSALGEKVLWNFYDATSLTSSTGFWGSILAPKANAIIGQDIHGSAVFAKVALNGEIHLNTFNGDLPAGAVPEPATWAMMIAGFGLVGGAMRRRKPAALAA